MPTDFDDQYDAEEDEISAESDEDLIELGWTMTNDIFILKQKNFVLDAPFFEFIMIMKKYLIITLITKLFTKTILIRNTKSTFFPP